MIWELLYTALAYLLGPPEFACGAVLTQPGTYVARQDCSGSSGPLVVVRGDGITLDFAGHTFRCVPRDPSTAEDVGILAWRSQDIVVRGGKVTGCHTGLSGPYANRIEIRNMSFSGSTYIGVNLGGTGHVIARSRFEDIGGYSLEAYAVAINGPGDDSVIEDNVIRNIRRQTNADHSQVGEGVGILVTSESHGVRIRNNRITNDPPSEGDIGIWTADRSRVVLSHNAIKGFTEGVVAAKGTLLRFAPVEAN